MYFRCFVIISPWKKVGHSFEQTWIPFIQGYFVPSLVEISQVVLEKKMNEKFTDGRTDRQTDDGRQVIRKAHLSFQFRWAKKTLNFCHLLKNALCQVWEKLVQSFWRWIKNVKHIIHSHTIGIWTNFDQKSGLALSAQTGKLTRTDPPQAILKSLHGNL